MEMLMSDHKEHTTQGGVDWELRTAEAALVVAPGGGTELALAMQRHADGVRNMMQSELVPSFEKAIDRIMAHYTGNVLEQIGGLRGDNTTLQAEFRDGLSSVQGTVSTLAETVNDLQDGMHESRVDRQTLHEELAAVKQDIATIRAEIAMNHAAFTAYAAGTRRAELDGIKAQLAELRGDFTPEQRQHYVDILMQMIAAWEGEHATLGGDGE